MSKFADKFGKLSEGMQLRVESERGTRSSKTVSGQLGAVVTERDAALDRADAAEAKLTALQNAMRVSVDDLHEVKGRRRLLARDEYEELKDNIRQYGIISPLTVESRAEGGYNIISGHHRKDVLRELAEENPKFAEWSESVPIHITEADERGDEKAFYANLFHPSLPDYEKWLGLKKLTTSLPASEVTLEQLSRRTGVSIAQVSRIMQFGELPSGILKLLGSYPKAVGSNLAGKLVRLKKSVQEENLVAAVQQIVEAGISQDSAYKVAAKRPQSSKSPLASLNRIQFKNGKEIYCTLTPLPKQIRLEFKSDDERILIQQKIEAVISEIATKKV